MTNVLTLMCDQLNPTVLDCYGGPVPMPNLKRLVDRGMIFNQATCPEPVCSPARASFLTGLYPHTHGICTNVNRREYPTMGYPDSEEGLKASEPTTDKVLFDNGYETHHFGKLHLLDEDLPYYSDMYGEHHEYRSDVRDQFDAAELRPREEWMKWYEWSLPVEVADNRKDKMTAQTHSLYDARENLTGWKPSDQLVDFVVKVGRLEMKLEDTFEYRVAQKTIEALQKWDKSSPFAITCSFNQPHDPNVVPSPYYEMIDPAMIELPVNNKCEPRFIQNWGRLTIDTLGEEYLREFLRIYYANCMLLDEQIGRVLNVLEETGSYDDTLIVFTADHGDMTGGHGMMWKSTEALYDEIVRVPLIMSLSGKIPKGSSDLNISLTDCMPTILGLAGQEIPTGIQGKDLSPFIAGTTDLSEAPEFTVCERVLPDPGQVRSKGPTLATHIALRNSEWKYVCYMEGDEYLYHLKSDRGEETNLALEDDHAATLSVWRDRARSWLREHSYQGPLLIPHT